MYVLCVEFSHIRQKNKYQWLMKKASRMFHLLHQKDLYH